MSNVALAALPILVLLALMIGLRWSTAAAGLTALGATLVIALAAFGFGADEPGRIRALTGVLAEAGFSTATIAWILLPALAIHHLQQRTGSIDLLQRAIRGVSGEPAVIALLVAWFFALFLEGVAGFGTPVALAAPFLTSVGFTPIAAVRLALIGHAVGVSFGAIGTPIHAQVTATGGSGLEIARATASYVVALGWLIPVAMMVSVVARIRGNLDRLTLAKNWPG
jgi:lactate permease